MISLDKSNDHNTKKSEYPVVSSSKACFSDQMLVNINRNFL